MRMIMSLVVLAMMTGGCASAPRPRAAPFKPAAEQHDPTPRSASPRIAPGTVIGPSMPATTTTSHPAIGPVRAVAVANRRALDEPTSAGFVNAVQVYPFSDNALYRLYAAPQEVTDIILQPGETLSAISAGDTVRWTVGDTTSGSGPTRQVHVLVKPFAAGLKTNLVILTDRRTYHLELESTAHVAMAAISWRYPNDSLVAAKSGAASDTSAVIDSGIDLEHLNFDYKISGDSPPWRPLRAFDDGRKVYVEFPATIAQGDAPPLFVQGQSGSELVNYRMRGNYYVVDRLFGAAELRLGQGKQQIVRITRTNTADKRGALASLFGG
ncbi:MAG: P-type conjugative transfer protein TrbG [Alphaproteobacteria bacterium]|nr:P-type conjugative transfer protein TrbG [Alphaproteobacteria bacterium]MDE2112216.1 P-type conjugative transfer protein TrbG [Alphaproteobacteria bacterium]MDE2494148.1 P-type conjugative transfer protein TrbG [Alphaproteobacteria bacterium]